MTKSFKGSPGKGHGKGRGPKQGQGHGKNADGKGQSRREIKNARGLRDVIGGGGGRFGGPTGQGQARVGSAQGAETPSTKQAGRPAEAQGRSKGPASSKLTYIMNFTPPPGAEPRSGVRAADQPTRPQSKPKHHTRRGDGAGSKAPTPAAKPAFGQKQKPQPKAPVHGKPPKATTRPAKNLAPDELHARTDFAWPSDRVRTQTPLAPPGRGGRTDHRRVQGIVKRHPDGFGFLIPDDPQLPDVYISRQYMDGIMTNDRVEAEVYQGKGRDRMFGEIYRVVDRGIKRIVGRFMPVDLKYGVIQDDGRGWGMDLRISMNESMNAKEGDMVAVEITRYPGGDREFCGKVVSLLGDAEDPLNDVKRVIYSQGIPTEFSPQALEEAKRFGGEVTETEIDEREDLRDLDLITIDGATARDFDDAICTERMATGFRLVVAIADVSHYVKPATHLDEDAYARGTSTYFPNFVVPMLPEELSNELCSLKPNVPRLCFACEMFLNFNGEVVSFRFFEAVMQSKARVIYGEAQEVIDGHTPAKLKHVEENILRSADLAKILMQKRFREGSLDLEIPETQVVVDAAGETVDIIKSERLFAHRLIEELMLVTNICTARFFDQEGLQGIYRIHDEPKEDNIRALQRYLWNFGGTKSVLGGNLQKKLTKALQAMEGKPEAQVLNILTLRAMNQAQYSSENIGHFGLGFSHYAHFTSPIRRYPDLIAHRLIKSRLYPRYRTMEMTEDELASASTNLSACEQRSVKAERQLISIKKARFARRLIDQELDGMISSVTKFGVFVLLRQYDIDGLVKIEALGNDRFIFDDENLKLFGKRTGIEYGIGDLIRVRVVGADPELGRIEFELAKEANEAEGDDDLLALVNDIGEEKPSGFKHGKNKRSTRQPNRDQAGPKGRKTRGGDVQKRGKTQDDRQRVRQKRVSKRRGKN